jgi:peptidoglycan/xylan/chitin deacetylase (PgdA/CDA1 family)
MPRIMHSHKTIMVVYHSINEYREDRIRIPNIVTPSAFEAQIQSMASTACFITLQQYLDHMREGRPLSKTSIIVTFDDGYKDNLTIASPILRKYGVPATFFISTGYMGREEMKWEDQLSCMIRRTEASAISVSLPSGNASFDISNDKNKFKVINALVFALGHLSQAERSSILGELREQSHLNCADQAGVMMTWDDVQQIANTPGYSVGSHTVTHQHLTRIPLSEALFEVTRSKEQLEGEIKQPVTTLSYPYGDFNSEIIAALKNAGYTCGATIEYGSNTLHSDPFRLKRVLVPNQVGVQFELGMMLRTSVFGELLRKGYNASKGQSDPY